MRKRGDDSAEHFTVSAVKLALQSAEKSDFVRVQRTAVQVKPLRNSDTAMTARHRFNRVGAGQYLRVGETCIFFTQKRTMAQNEISFH